MKINIYSTIVVMLVLFSSCFNDKTEFGTNKISEITLDEEWKSTYNVDKWETFTMDPKLSQSIADKELNYEWQIDYKVVGTEKELSYVCEKLGSYSCRFKAYNEDGATFKEFTLKVNSPYEQGLLLLSKSADKSMLSFKRMEKDEEGEYKEGYSFVKNVYAQNNPTIELGATPTLVLNHQDYVYIGSTNPIKVIRMNSKTFEVSNILEYPGNIAAGGVFNPNSSGITFIGDGTVYDYETRQNAFMSNLARKFPSDVEISKHSVKIDPGYAFFDDNIGRLYFYDNRYKVSELSAGEFSGKKLLNLMGCDENKNFLAIMKDPSNGDPYIVRYIIATSDSEENILEKNYNAKGTTIDINGVFLTSSQLTNLYYSSGNKVYAYNYLANNFPTDAIITLDNDAVIKSMLFDYDEKRMFIAANIGDGDLNGTVYCYDMETKEQVWKEEGVAGDIVQMIYKR